MLGFRDEVRVRNQRKRKFAEVTFITLNDPQNVGKTSEFSKTPANLRKLLVPLISYPKDEKTARRWNKDELGFFTVSFIVHVITRCLQ